MLTPFQSFGDFLFAVKYDGHRLFLHTNGHSMPPAIERLLLRYISLLQGSKLGLEMVLFNALITMA